MVGILVREGVGIVQRGGWLHRECPLSEEFSWRWHVQAAESIQDGPDPLISPAPFACSASTQRTPRTQLRRGSANC